MKEVQITRKFNYNGITLDDPNPALSADAVREVYVGQFPELAVSVVDGPVTKAGVSTYKFLRAAGDKGRCQEKSEIQKAVDEIASGGQSNNDGVMPSVEDRSESAGFAGRLRNLQQQSPQGRNIRMPSSAYGIWG